MGNAGSPGGALPPRPPLGPPGSGLPSWLPGNLPLSSRAPGEFPPGGWGPAIGTFPLQGGAGNHYYYYYNTAQVAFATSYLQGIAMDHYTAILCFNPGHPLFTNWQAFINEFFSKFSMFDTVAEAERKLMFLRMSANKCFTMFIVQFEKEAYKTGWNYNTLRFQLSKAMPKRIHDVLQLSGPADLEALT
ncbi:hypothetical protein C0995_014341 [Termitomyces sp. Mi166|nr:hypothetical protein C0995_014341 [Termitomyces sp. Mi166\